MGNLTQRQVDTLKTPGRYGDGAGLALLVRASGVSSWQFRYTLAGRTRDMALGKARAYSLKEARALSVQARASLDRGIDPMEARNAGRKPSGVPTFQKLATDYIARRHTQATAQWRKTWLRRLELHAFPVLGSVPVDQIKASQVVEVLDKVWMTKPHTAEVLRAQIEAVIDAAIALEHRTEANPAQWKGRLSNLLCPTARKVGKNGTGYDAMPYAEVPALMEKLRQSGDLFAPALRFLILTAARTHMVREARWSEFDLDAGLWQLSAERMKSRKAFTVPLSVQAVELLRALPRRDGDDDALVFHGRLRSSLFSPAALLRLLTKLDCAGIVPHGFRSSFRTWADEQTEYPRDVCELALAHEIKGKIEAIYSKGTRMAGRPELMADWAAYVTATVEG